MIINDLETTAGVAVLVALIVQLIKGRLDESNIPLVAVAIGIVVGMAASLILGHSAPIELGNAFLTGLLGGASAIGIYQVQKPTGILAPKE